jgi:hypothetical protein
MPVQAVSTPVPAARDVVVVIGQEYEGAPFAIAACSISVYRYE